MYGEWEVGELVDSQNSVSSQFVGPFGCSVIGQMVSTFLPGTPPIRRLDKNCVTSGWTFRAGTTTSLSAASDLVADSVSSHLKSFQSYIMSMTVTFSRILFYVLL